MAKYLNNTGLATLWGCVENFMQTTVSTLSSLVASKADAAHTHTAADITGLPSGVTSYRDLTDKPDIPAPIVIADNLTTDNAAVVLSARQGAELKALLDAKATPADIDQRIQQVIGTAPEALDTLGEIAERLSDNSDEIEAINGVLTGKTLAAHTHTLADLSDLTILTADDITPLTPVADDYPVNS